MPKKRVDVEDELAAKLEVISPEYQARSSLIEEALTAAGAMQPAAPAVAVSDMYDDELLKLIDSVTLE